MYQRIYNRSLDFSRAYTWRSLVCPTPLAPYVADIVSWAESYVIREQANTNNIWSICYWNLYRLIDVMNYPGPEPEAIGILESCVSAVHTKTPGSSSPHYPALGFLLSQHARAVSVLQCSSTPFASLSVQISNCCHVAGCFTADREPYRRPQISQSAWPEGAGLYVDPTVPARPANAQVAPQAQNARDTRFGVSCDEASWHAQDVSVLVLSVYHTIRRSGYLTRPKREYCSL